METEHHEEQRSRLKSHTICRVCLIKEVELEKFLLYLRITEESSGEETVGTARLEGMISAGD